MRRRAAKALTAEPVVRVITPAREPAVRIPEPEPPSRQPYEPEMVLIPAGPFLMGSPKTDKLRFGVEPEQYELDLPYDYAIAKYPVTVRQYRYFMEANGYREDRWWTVTGLDARAKGWEEWESFKPTGRPWTQPHNWGESPWTDSDDLPVSGVSWYEAYAYTQWLAEATGRDYRLLTEAEWEKAARGGLMIPDGKGGMKKNPTPARIFPWGDEEPDEQRLNFNGNLRGTTPVDSYPTGASPYGVLDMAGNVWELCLSTWAVPFVYPEQNDPSGDSLRLIRGGPWFYGDRLMRCSVRGGCDPRSRFGVGLGFRVGGVFPVLP